MCDAIRFSRSEFPNEELFRFGLRGNNEDIKVSYFANNAVLPVLIHGESKIIPWGNKKQTHFPKTGFCKWEALISGGWQWLKPRAVLIVVKAAQLNGVWFQVKKGIKGILVEDKKRNKRVYILTEPSTHYFKIMTGSMRMPILEDQML